MFPTAGGDSSLRHFCDAATAKGNAKRIAKINAKGNCQEMAAAVANFRHMKTAKRGDPT
jgi:hypothetical protein